MVSWILMVSSIESLNADWLWCLVVMVVTIESKVTINGTFYATGPMDFFYGSSSHGITLSMDGYQISMETKFKNENQHLCIDIGLCT